MAEKKSQGNEKKPVPPKIKLGAVDSDALKFVKSGGAVKKSKPKPSISTDKKSETSRIDLSEAMTPGEVVAEAPPTIQDALTSPTEQMTAPTIFVDESVISDDESKKSTIKIDAVEEAPLPAGSGIVSEMSEEDLAAVEEAAKRSTIRIDMPLEEPIQPIVDIDAKKSTIKIDAPEEALPAGSGIVSEMSEEDLAAVEEAAKRSTIRIDMPLEEPVQPVVDTDARKSTIKIDSPEDDTLPLGSGIVADMGQDELESVRESAKSSTIRIDMPLEAAPAPVPPEEPKKSTIQVALPDTESTPSVVPPVAKSLTETQKQSLLESTKKSTIRIDVPSERLKKIEPEDVVEATKKQTVRVQVDDIAHKGDTQPVNSAAVEQQILEGMKKTTTRLDMGEVLSGEEDADIFKKRTAVLDSSKFPTSKAPSPTGPRTIRIKRPTQTPPTAVLSTPAAPPTASLSAPAPVAVPSVEDAKKSETARIELPPEASSGTKMQTRRKTVRIKRPDGTAASRELTISRPSGKASKSSARVEKTEVPGEQDIHPVFSVVALCAAIVTLVLLYVLAAQTIAPGLPFPGRLG